MKDEGYGSLELVELMSDVDRETSWHEAGKRTGLVAMMMEVQQRKVVFSILAVLCFWFAQLTDVEAQCVQVYERGVGGGDIRVIVDGHNNIRNQIARGTFPGLPRGKNFKQMKWDQALANEAQRIANSCVFAHQKAHDRRWGWVGQNLYTSMSTANSRGADWGGALRSWSNEAKYYKYGGPVTSQNGHFTQMIWADSEYIGCGFVNYKSNDPKWRYKKLYVCNYGPGGNISGRPPYQRAYISSIVAQILKQGSICLHEAGKRTGLVAMMKEVQQRKVVFSLLAVLCSWFAQLTDVEAQCVQVFERGVGGGDIKVIVDGHNKIRNEIARGTFPGLPRGKNFKQMVHGRWGYVGQNMYIWMSPANSRGADWPGALRYWSDEAKYYKYGGPITSQNGHFTEMIWADTEYIGCGYINYKSNDPKWTYKKLYVCNYGPG
nr:unnamed protein product [Callosobruchus analis]